MAPKINWHRYGTNTKLRHCHPICCMACHVKIFWISLKILDMSWKSPGNWLGWIWYTRPMTVTHPGTNLARCGLTLFMRRMPLTTMPRSSVCAYVRLSHHPTTAKACGGFAAECHAARRYQSIASAAQQQRRRGTALSSKCEQCHVDSRCRKLNTAVVLVLCAWQRFGSS